MPIPNKKETEDEFISRCIPMLIDEGKDSDQAAAICHSKWDNKDFSKNEIALKQFFSKISIDYDGVLSTSKGKELAKKLAINNTIYIISARSNKENMVTTAKNLGIPLNRIFATSSNKAKIEKIKELNINTHYDNNNDVVKELGTKGKLF